MSGAMYVSLLALAMTAAACGGTEPAAPPPVEKKSSKEVAASSSSGDDEGGLSSSDSKNKVPSAYHIRQNRKQTLDMQLQLLETDLQFAMSNYNSLRGQKYRTLEKGIPSTSDPTVQGKLVEAGTSFLFGGLGLAISGIGSAGSSAGSAVSGAADAAKKATSGSSSSDSGSKSGGGGSSTSGLDGFSSGFVAIGGAVSAGITKDENDKTIKRITGTVEEMMQQWEMEIANIQSKIDATQAEIDSLVNMGV